MPGEFSTLANKTRLEIRPILPALKTHTSQGGAREKCPMHILCANAYQLTWAIEPNELRKYRGRIYGQYLAYIIRVQMRARAASS